MRKSTMRITSILQTFLLIMFAVCPLNVRSYCLASNLSVDLSSLNLLVSEQLLDGGNGQAVLDEQGSKCMPCGMEGVMLRYTSQLQDFPQPFVCGGVTADFSYQPLNASVSFNNGGCFAPEYVIKGNIYHEAGLNHFLVDPLLAYVLAPECNQVRETQTGVTGEQKGVFNYRQPTIHINLFNTAQLWNGQEALTGSHGRYLIVHEWTAINNLMPDCLVHNSSEETEATDARIMSDTQSTHPVLIGDQKGVVNISNQNAGTELLDIPEQCLVAFNGCPLTLGTDNNLIPEIDQCGSGFNLLLDGTFQSRQRQIDTTLEELQFDMLNIKQRHPYRMVQTVSKWVINHTTVFPLVATDIGVCREIHTPSGLAALNFNKSFA